MSDVNTEYHNGDVSVSRNVTIGGDTKIAGDAEVSHNLHVKGWLDAENIKGANKGIFRTEDALRRAYPNPKAGWFAGVGLNSPIMLYVHDEGRWIGTGSEMVLNVDLTEVGELREKLSECHDKIEALETDNKDNKEQISKLTKIVDDISADGNFKTILLTSSDVKMGIVIGNGTYAAGSSVTIYAVANNGYRFVRWSDGNVSSIRKIALYDDISLTAEFAVKAYKITAMSSDDTMGTAVVVGGGTMFAYKSAVAMEAEAKAGYRFVGWYRKGVVMSTSNVYTILADEDMQYEARFEAIVEKPKDYYIGFTNITDEDAFSRLLDTDLIGNAVGYSRTDVPAWSGDFSTGKVLYMMYRAGSEPQRGWFNKDGALPTTFIREDFSDSSKWPYLHEGVKVGDTRYTVIGFGGRAELSKADTMDIEFI